MPKQNKGERDEEIVSQPPAKPGKLDRPPKSKPLNRLLKPNGRTGNYETK